MMICVTTLRTCVVHPGVTRALVKPGERRSSRVFWPNNENMLSALLECQLIRSLAQ